MTFAALYKSAQMTLTATSGSQTIIVRLDVVLDDTYFGNGFETILDNYVDGSDLQEYLNNPDTYKELMNLELPFQFGDAFKRVDGNDITEGLTVEGNDKFGYYKLTNSKVTTGVVDLLCTQYIKADEIYDLKEDGGKILCGSQNIKVNVQGYPVGAGEYTCTSHPFLLHFVR